MTDSEKDQNSQDEKKPDKVEESVSQAESLDGSGMVMLHGKIEIFPGKMLPAYSNDYVKSYEANYKNSSALPLYAVLCERALVPRHGIAEMYAGILNPYAAQLADHGVVYWPSKKEERYVFVYKNMPSKPLVDPSGTQAGGMNQDDVMAGIVNPMVSLLQDFHERDFVHGCIRPSNLYGRGGDRIESFVLGDGIAIPASLSQPVLYETIPRGMVDPIGRGLGTPSDDMYSFGATLATLLRSDDPLKGLDDDNIIRAKIEIGSYAALTGKDRFTGSILELLRGLLHDDPTQRWTIEEVATWVDGRRLSPKQANKQPRAPRAIAFSGEKYFRPSFLSMDIDTDPQELQRLVDDGDLEQWITRSLEDKEVLARLEVAVASSREKGTGGGYVSRLVANIASALYPDGPIRYKSLRVFADGIGKALAEAFYLKKDVKIFADMFMQNIVMNWISSQVNSNLDLRGLIAKFDQCRKFMQIGKTGYGLERCLYLLSTDAPCYSEKLRGHYVLNSEQMIRAFEDMCDKGDAPRFFFDNHSISFLNVRDSKVIEHALYELSASEDYKKVIGDLKALASIQQRYKMEKFPAIGVALEKKLSVVYARFHDSEAREKVKKKVSGFAREGALDKMLDLMDNPEASKGDLRAFKIALQEYEALQSEYDTLSERLKDKDKFGLSTGNEVAALVSSALAGLIVLFVVFMSLTGSG